VSLTYGFTGTTNFDGIRLALAHGLGTGATFGLVFVLAGLAFKISAAPFHMWTPDVYEGAPTPSPRSSRRPQGCRADADDAREPRSLWQPAAAWQQIIIFAALLSIVIGALGAIGQTNIKRLMAYSSINNVGFMLVGLAAATPGCGCSVYLAIYVAMSVAGFVAILMLRDANGEQVEAISDLAGLSKTRPGLARRWPA
jgi:NADH-quinone oxidoreductase subunit N